MIKVKLFQVGIMANNAYLIYSEKNKDAIVVDPSLAYNEISYFCKQNDLIVTKVLLTHGHYDHIFDAYLFQRDGALVFAHKNSLFNINSDYSKHQLSRRGKDTPQIDQFFTNNQVFDFLNTQIKIFHTPGHSACSCVFALSNYLFTGDTLFKNSYGRYDFEDSSFEDLISSIKFIFNLKKDYIICPGHEEISHLYDEIKHNPILNCL